MSIESKKKAVDDLAKASELIESYTNKLKDEVDNLDYAKDLIGSSYHMLKREDEEEKTIIDLSVLIKSQIDCEFRDNSNVLNIIGKLRRVTSKNGQFLSDRHDGWWEECRPRMNELLANKGYDYCPIPLGFIVEVHYIDGTIDEVTEDYEAFTWSRNWIRNFSIIGVQEGFIYPWEQEK